MSTTASLLLVWTDWFPCQQLGTLKEIRNGQSVDFINCFNGTKCSTIIVKRRNLKSEINTWGVKCLINDAFAGHEKHRLRIQWFLTE